MTTMPRAASQVDSAARTPHSATPGQSERQTRRQRRLRRHILDRVMWTASGAALGAGLIVIATYIMIGDWI